MQNFYNAITTQLAQLTRHLYINFSFMSEEARKGNERVSQGYYR